MKMSRANAFAALAALALLALLASLAWLAPWQAESPEGRPGSADAVAAAPGPQSAAEAPEAGLRLLVLGDSLSSAYGLKIEEGWVALVSERLRGDGIGVNVINASIAGETTRGGVYRLPQLLSEHQPDMVIVELGANDGLRGLDLDALTDNLMEIVRQCRDQGAEVIIAAIPVTSNYGDYVLERMRQSYRQVSEHYGVALVDFFDRDFVNDPLYYQPDRLHPNAKAQELIAEAFWSELSALAARLAARD